jgi:hypothetical protein
VVNLIMQFSPGDLAIPIWGGATPPLYERGNCTIKAEAGLFLTLEGVGDLSMDYDCAYKGTNTGVTCETCWMGPACTYPMDTRLRFNSGLGLKLSVKANLNACGWSSGQIGDLMEIGAGTSVQITDILMRSRDKYCGFLYTGFRGTPEVRGGDLSWNGLHCVMQGHIIPKGFQEHCTRFLNQLLRGAKSKMQQVLAVKLAEQRLSAR